MTDKERYRKACDEAAASGMRKLEVNDVINTGKHGSASRRVNALLIAAVLFVISVAGAYATDIGGIRRGIQLWFGGERIEATVTVSDGGYRIENADGEVLESGGGVALERNGTERPLTDDEIMEHLESEPRIEFIGEKMMIVFRENTVDLSELFESGIARVELPDQNGKTMFITVTSDGTLAASNDGFVDP